MYTEAQIGQGVIGEQSGGNQGVIGKQVNTGSGNIGIGQLLAIAGNLLEIGNQKRNRII